RDLRKPRPRWRRWLRGLGVALLALVVCEAGRYGFNHYQVTKRLQAALDELDAQEPGWRLAELEAARAELPAGRNGARCGVAPPPDCCRAHGRAPSSPTPSRTSRPTTRCRQTSSPGCAPSWTAWARP